MKKSKPPLSPVDRMLKQKRNLIARCKADIADIRADAEAKVGKIQARIKVAETLVRALERGELVP